jgi:hypothetical protein
MLRRSKRIAEKEQHHLQKDSVRNICLKMSKYLTIIHNTTCIVKKIDTFNLLFSYFLINKNILKINSDIKTWNFYEFIKIVYIKNKEIYSGLPEIFKEYKFSKHKINYTYAITHDVILFCKNEIWESRKYLFKLPLPNDIIRQIFLEWL